MPSETSHNRPPQPQASAAATTPRQPKTSPSKNDVAAAAAGEPLPCPRCDSTNTKFCYYNNYSLAQPRHFCKSCRRYWTHGGALRNVPIGGGTRKSSSSSSSKRRRAFYSSSAATASSASHSPPSSTSVATTSSALSTLTHEPEPLTVSVPSKVEGLCVGCGNGDNLTTGSMPTMNQSLNGLYMGLGGYGFYESGLGVLGTAGGKAGVLPYHAMGLGNYLNFVGGVPNTWQLLGEVGVGAGAGAGGVVEGGGSSGCGESLARHGIAIPTPGDTSSK